MLDLALVVMIEVTSSFDCRKSFFVIPSFLRRKIFLT